MSLEKKIDRLKNYLKDKKCVLGFSAGSDSTLLAYILSQVSPDSLIVTIDNSLFPDEFIDYAKNKAKEIGLEHRIIKLNFFDDPEFIKNHGKRCYNCRNLMYYNISQLDDFDEYEYFIEGTNITDLLEDRPGVLIRDKYNMTSPLVECSITKEDVFNMLKYFNLDYSANTTCLSTRVKTNEHISKEKFDIIDKSEQFLRENINQENIRVRFDNYTGTISTDEPLEILDKDLLEKLRNQLQENGFKKVLLDITGYEKTKLEYSIDENNNYYYQLPYNIDLDVTSNKLDKNPNLNETYTKNEDNIVYEDITINENGKLSITNNEEFVEKINNILPVIQRKL